MEVQNGGKMEDEEQHGLYCYPVGTSPMVNYMKSIHGSGTLKQRLAQICIYIYNALVQ